MTRTNYKYEYANGLTYEDDGCVISSKCIECPLPECKYDDPLWYAKYRTISKYRVVLYLLKMPHTTEDMQNMARHYNLTTRTLFRLKKKMDLDNYEQKYIDLFANCVDRVETSMERTHE